LNNGAPLVVHVFAVSGSDVGSVPIYSGITDPGAGAASADVRSGPITVPANTLLLSWVKNDSGATAAGVDGFTLDAQSTSYLWGASEGVLTGGSVTGHFAYDRPIGWQTAVVGVVPIRR
jgi:hypothetical protein